MVLHAPRIRFAAGFGIALAARLSASGPAAAGPPDPAHCYVAPRLVSCPAGDSTYVVIVRGATDFPWFEACCVEVHLDRCSGYHLSRAGSHAYTVDSTGRIVSLPPELNTGTAEFALAGGGLCPGDTVLVRVEGLNIGQTLAVASFDQNGDLAVTQADVAIVQSKVGTNDPTADFDGDGKVTAADVALVLAHLGHRALDAVDAVAPEGPWTLALSAPAPNPFAGRTRFTLTLADAAPVRVDVVDVAGRQVARVFDGTPPAGSLSLEWDGRREDGAPARGGVYFVSAVVAGRRLDRRMVVLGGR
jgi:hypothetical protein